MSSARTTSRTESANGAPGTGLAADRPPASPVPDDEALLQSGFRYAFALTHHHHDAEDLVQTAWLRLHVRGGARATKPLLFTTIRNLHVDQYRRRQRFRHTSLDAAERCRAVPADDREPHDGAALGRLLGRLREAEREALFLHAVAGYSADEIATLTGRPRGTVLSLMHRGRRRLRELAAAQPTGRTP